VRIEWTDRAEDDLEDIEAYFGQYNLQSGMAAGVRIEDHVKLLESFPDMGHPGTFSGTREVVVPKSRCVVVYRVEQELVRVLRIFHGGQERPQKL
jgi:addiction module RelE/StbE family toxin